MRLELEIRKRIYKSDRTILAEMFSAFRWKDRNGRIVESQQSIHTFKFAAILKFLDFTPPIPTAPVRRVYIVNFEAGIEFLDYVALIPARYWQVWEKVNQMLNAGWSRRRILHYLATKAIALQLRR